MDHVERRHLVVLLPHDEEDSVEEVHKLGEEVPPAHPQHSEGPWVLEITRVIVRQQWQWQGNMQCLGVVHRLAVPVVLPGQVECPTLLEHPEAEESLHKVDMSRYSVDVQ